VHDLAFNDADRREPGLLRSVLLPIRLILRRLLRPILLRQSELFRSLSHRVDSGEGSTRTLRDDLGTLAARHDAMAGQLRETLAYGPEYATMVHRLARLEDQLAVLTGHATTAPPEEAVARSSILFPRPEARSPGDSQATREQG
jgi:hypothetical protein